MLCQGYDGNPSLSLPLCNYPFGQKYADRSVKTLKFLINIVSARILQKKPQNEKTQEVSAGQIQEVQETDTKVTPDDYTRFANIKDRIGRTVLHTACQHGVSLDIIKALVEDCHAKPEAQDMEDQKPIDYCVQFDNCAGF